MFCSMMFIMIMDRKELRLELPSISQRGLTFVCLVAALQYGNIEINIYEAGPNYAYRIVKIGYNIL